MSERDHQLIAELNDRFRQGDTTLGQWVLTQGVKALAPTQLSRLIRKVKAFDAFNMDNDPHGEHDFGAIDLNGERYYFKIDYYDPTLKRHSTDPTSPNATRRVLTLMRADEY